MKNRYYTLQVKWDGVWGNEFGSYDKQDVLDEIDYCYDDCQTRIVIGDGE